MASQGFDLSCFLKAIKTIIPLTDPFRKKEEAYLVFKVLCYQHFNGTRKISKCLQNKVWPKPHLTGSFHLRCVHLIIRFQTPEAGFCDTGRVSDYFAGKPLSQTGFPKEVLGQGSFILTSALPSGQPCCFSPTVNRQLEGPGNRGTLFPIVLHASHFPFISGNSWNL